ncbi:MAG: hypothetical protein DWP92_06620 [Armatimonadetes bacterium]|nr:MAG: hypothetical protein DWP92_06620 [Armatimonadota bacterium]
MGILGPEIAAAVFDTVEKAEEGWALLSDADIPATVITDPGILGAFSVSILVQRDDLDDAQKILAPLVTRRPPTS